MYVDSNFLMQKAVEKKKNCTTSVYCGPMRVVQQQITCVEWGLFLFKGSMERYDEDKRGMHTNKMYIVWYARYSHMSRYKHFHFIVV